MPNMSDINGYFQGPGTGAERYTNPFYGIPLQYLPLNIDGMLWWADHFLLRFGFYRTALNRIASYFITSLSIDCDDEKAKETYQEVFDKLRWKESLITVGLNLLAYGNAFVSVNQGFNRFLICPKCYKASNIDKMNNFEFQKGVYSCHCPKCGYKGPHERKDVPIKDVEKLNMVVWNPREIKLRHEETTDEYEYYWDIPQTYISKVTARNNRFFSKKTPGVIYDAIFEKKLIAFKPTNFLHLKFPTPASIKTDGKAIPLCIYLFDDFFMLKVLERQTEAICFEDIAPFRVIAMDTAMGGSNPILGQNGGVWASAMEEMVNEHRKDPGSYHVVPFTINYQQLGGDGKNLVPVEMLQNAQANILNALNIPQEMYNMTLQTQAVGPALRLFENSWSMIPDSYNRMLQHWADVIAKIKGLPPAKVTLLPITFADDMERKSVIGQLVSSNSIARSEFLKLYNFEYEDQIRKRMEEDRIAKELQEEEQEKEQLRQTGQASIFGPQQGGGGAAGGQPGQIDYSTSGMNPNETLSKAEEVAQQLKPMDGAGRRTELQKIKAHNETLYHAVKGKLDQMGDSDSSQGRQQGQQPPQ